MKIAIATDTQMVSEHFGHCEGFTVYEVEEQQITQQAFLPNPGHRPGFLPNYLHEQGVNVIIAGGMGGGAIEIFDEKGIEVITGASGNVEQIIEAYLNGKLESSASVCHQHQHADECGEH